MLKYMNTVHMCTMNTPTDVLCAIVNKSNILQAQLQHYLQKSYKANNVK